MRLTLHRYIFRQIWPTFASCLFVFVLIMVATETMSLTEWIAEKGVHPVHVLKLLLYILPNGVLLALPAASLMAVLIAFLRMSGDNEIIALNSAGISLFQMLPPVAALSLFSYFLASFMALVAAPWGNRNFEETVFKMIESRARFNVKERVFYELFEDVVLYVNRVSPDDGAMKDILLVDKRDESATNSIVAKEGRIIPNPERRTVTIHFEDGTVFMVEKALDGARSVGFKTYALNLNLDDMMASVTSRKRSPDEMYIHELMRQITQGREGGKKYNEMVIRLLENFTIPLAALLMGLIGAPLGAQIRSRGRSLGVSVGLMVFMIYYVFMMGARSICETGTVSPFVGMWFPNIFLAACCIMLLRMAKGGEAANVDLWVQNIQGYLRLRPGGPKKTP
ncbi:MAG: LPS export ABC transporter permease LptF [Desulfatiglandales bacterium]